MKIRVLIALIILLMAAGCLKRPAELGCCLKDNISQGCVLYNTTDFSTTDFISTTHGPCDNESYNTTGACNVTIYGADYLLPICTQDQLVQCIDPDCTAMVCGDYKYTPRVAPGFISVEESEGDIPPDVDEEEAIQFYKAQCRFLPMDANLRQIMRNSRSQINVFRMGVGGSFDEYEQYRFFFPMSDKFCNINPKTSSTDLRVDRYMNYLGADGKIYDPINGITENCLNDTDTPPPFQFSENGSLRGSLWWGFYPQVYNPVLPDKSNYNLTHYGTMDFPANFVSSHGGFYDYRPPTLQQYGVFKEIEEGSYKRSLSVAHASTIYGLTSAKTTRAPFECDVKGSDCYSGDCNTRVYQRSVMLGASEIPGGGPEVVTDCNDETDVNGRMRIVCAPTKSVTVTSQTQPPKITYAKVDAIPVHMEARDGSKNPEYNFQSFAKNKKLLDDYWDEFNNSKITMSAVNGSVRTITYTMESMNFDFALKKDCPWDYGPNNDTNIVRCSYVYESSTAPPAGGAVFFGKVNRDQKVTYGTDTIIGYAIARPGDFEKMLVVKNCNLSMKDISNQLPAVPDPGEETFYCHTRCMSLCSGTPDIYNKCSAYCSGGAKPCTPSPPAQLTETKDFVRVELSDPNDWNWKVLMNSFYPYFKDVESGILTGGFEDGCGKKINAYDPVIAAMPWVLSHEKGVREGGDLDEKAEVKYLTSTASEELRQRNPFDEPMNNNTLPISSCELRRYSMPWDMIHDVFADEPYYNLLITKHIYLFKYNETSKRLGDCAIDDTTFLPEMRTYGWCNPCTTSTLAYQNVTALDRVYLPYARANIEELFISDYQSICKNNMKKDSVGWGTYELEDNISCYNPSITDIDDYQGSLGTIGSPKTVPEASIMKERLGNYLKSGVMPVLDISDNSNWNRKDPDYVPPSGSAAEAIVTGIAKAFGVEIPKAGEYSEQFDFERLIGEMGAVIVIVDHVSGEATSSDVDRIVARSNVVRDECFGCIIAFHVDTPDSNESFKESVDSVLSDPRANFAIDMVTFDYPMLEHKPILFASLFAGGGTLVAKDIASYGRVALQSKGKPTMVVGLNFETIPEMTTEEYDIFLVNLVEEQDELVASGVTGIIYSPVRSTAASGTGSEGLVFVDSSGVGNKGAKFCSFQKAMQTMSLTPPLTLFTKVAAQSSANCTLCTSLDKLPGGSCSMLCDNGVECTLPSGISETDGTGNYKCPSGTVIDPCTLCNETSGSYDCTLTYRNGTKEPLSGPMTDISSDLYLDVVAGIPSPYKCCLRDSTSGTNYSYTKDTYPAPINKPLVFSKTGDENADCAMGGAESVGTLSSFCGMSYSPLKEYDINCSIS